MRPIRAEAESEANGRGNRNKVKNLLAGLTIVNVLRAIAAMSCDPVLSGLKPWSVPGDLRVQTFSPVRVSKMLILSPIFPVATRVARRVPSGLKVKPATLTVPLRPITAGRGGMG